MNNPFSRIRPLILIFVLTNAFFLAGKALLEKWNADQDVLIGGNLLLFLVSVTAYFISWRALRSSNPQAFVRAMYGSFILKFFVVAIAAFVYIMVTRKEVNKPALFICLGLYVLYTAIEVSMLLKLLKRKKDA